MAGERKASFILKNNMPASFHSRFVANSKEPSPTTNRKKLRTVSEWARKKNMTFDDIKQEISRKRNESSSKFGKKEGNYATNEQEEA